MGKVVTFLGSTGNTSIGNVDPLVDGVFVDAPESWNWSTQEGPNGSPDVGTCSGDASTTLGGALLEPESSQLGVVIVIVYDVSCGVTPNVVGPLPPGAPFILAPTTNSPALIDRVDGATVTTTATAVDASGVSISTTYTITLHSGVQ
jgi:hypothetical protein